MTTKTLFLAGLITIFLYACGGGKSQIDQIKSETVKETTPMTLAEAEAGWKTNNGVGPVAGLELPADIDEELAETGKSIYDLKCTACHKVEKRFIGPSPQQIMTRRTPAWIMNMILNPEEMVQKDPIAKQLLIEYNGSPMANQNLKEEEARAIVEFFRTL